ncbi:hypothetical protein LZ31DRAFT_549995 [Colletotrichum somersetense]|nr:hypothetical protein LZ31DRAFT_549995 [Colletotrichum somersetense]
MSSSIVTERPNCVSQCTQVEDALAVLHRTNPHMCTRMKPVWARALFLAGTVTRISIYATAALSQLTA